MVDNITTNEKDLTKMLKESQYLSYTENKVMCTFQNVVYEINKSYSGEFNCTKMDKAPTNTTQVDEYGCIKNIETGWQFVTMKSTEDCVYLYPRECTENTIIISIVVNNMWYTKVFAVHPLWFNLLNQESEHQESQMQHFVRKKFNDWKNELKNESKKI
jgi:hypothetical protein